MDVSFAKLPQVLVAQKGGDMTEGKAQSTSGKAKKLKLEKETMRDIDLGNRGKRVKGGVNCPGSDGRFAQTAGCQTGRL